MSDVTEARFTVEVGGIKVIDENADAINEPTLEIGSYTERDVSPRAALKLLKGLNDLLGDRLAEQIAKLEAKLN